MDQSTRPPFAQSVRAVFLICILCGAACFAAATTARAAQSEWVGQIGDLTGSTGASCFSCTAFQWADDGTNSYRFPFNGIVTRYRIRVGTGPSGPETVQPRTFRLGATNHATVMTQGAAQSVNILNTSSSQDFLERFPAAVDNRLGARYTTSGASVANTHFSFGAGGA